MLVALERHPDSRPIVSTIMSDAAKARAEARKKAILAGRTNRLAKLTSTARGEEAAAAFIRDGTSSYTYPSFALS